MIIRRSKNNIREHGAVSLFIVLFTALLMTIVTVSFVQLMVGDQRQASYADLSQSAYDSALAGVEDAKRLLLLNQACQDGTADSSANCPAVTTALTPDRGETHTNCDTLVKAGIVGQNNDETLLQQHVEDSKLDQAYTCVKIRSDTPSFLGSADPNMSPVLVPLRGSEAISKIVLSWGINKDGGAINLPSGVPAKLPPVGASWPQNRPALLRAQLIKADGNFRLSDFDKRGYSSTLFLYPSDSDDTSANFVLDSRRTTPLGNEPQAVKCSSRASGGAYICQVTLNFASAIGAGSQVAFLSLSALYNATDFKVELMEGSGRTVSFDNVQFEVDSTGRANDLFRRVVSRVEMGGSFNYPQAALETAGKICKNFSVTTEPGDYSVSNNCRP